MIAIVIHIGAVLIEAARRLAALHGSPVGIEAEDTLALWALQQPPIPALGNLHRRPVILRAGAFESPIFVLRHVQHKDAPIADALKPLALGHVMYLLPFFIRRALLQALALSHGDLYEFEKGVTMCHIHKHTV